MTLPALSLPLMPDQRRAVSTNVQPVLETPCGGERKSLSASGLFLRWATLVIPVLLCLELQLQANTQIMVFPQGDTLCGLNVVNPPLYTGTLATATPPPPLQEGWTLTSTGLGGMLFTCGHYTIEFPTGAWERVGGGSGGFIVNTPSMICPPLPSEVPTPGMAYVVRKVMTVADVFGPAPNGPPGLIPGPQGTGDEIEMPNGDLLFYDAGSWQRKEANGNVFVNQGGEPIYFVQGFIFRRRISTPLTVYVTGDVKPTWTWMELAHVLVCRPNLSQLSLVSTITSVTRGGGSQQLTLASSGLPDYFVPGFTSEIGACILHVQDLPGSLFGTCRRYYYDILSPPQYATPSWVEIISTGSGLPIDEYTLLLPSAVGITRPGPSLLIRWNP